MCSVSEIYINIYSSNGLVSYVYFVVIDSLDSFSAQRAELIV